MLENVGSPAQCALQDKHKLSTDNNRISFAVRYNLLYMYVDMPHIVSHFVASLFLFLFIILYNFKKYFFVGYFVLYSYFEYFKQVAREFRSLGK